MSEPTDAKLVADALAGGPEAFGPIVDRYRAQVVSVAAARLQDFDQAEDVAQQVFLEAFEGLHLLKDAERLGAWLRTAAIHRSIDAVRRRREYVDVDSSELVDDANPEREAERGQLQDLVRAALSRLSAAQRETTTLFYLGGLSQDEVAVAQGVPVGTVKRRLHDARKKLKSEMMSMAEEILSARTPGDEFSTKVYNLLTRYYREPGTWPWARAVSEEEHEEAHRRWESEVGARLCLRSRGDLEPYRRGLAHPQALTRRHTFGALYYLYHQPDTTNEIKEAIRDLMIEGLWDSNKKIRARVALWLCRKMGLSDADLSPRALPRLLEMLFDGSSWVRRRAAVELGRRPRHVPLETAARALVAHQESPQMRRLVERVLAA